MMSATEDSELLEIDVRAHRRRIRRRRYRATCDCDPARRTLTAPPPPKLIPKGNYGISIWVHVLLDKYSSYRPTERLLGQLEQYDLDLPAGTVNDGLQRIEPMLQPIYEALLAAESAGRIPSGRRNPLAGFRAFGREKGLWLVVVGHPWRGHRDLSARFQPRPRGAGNAFRPRGFGSAGSRSVLRLQSHGAGEVGADRAGVLLGACAARLRGSGQELVGVDALGTFLVAPHSTRLSDQSGTSAVAAGLRDVSRTRCLAAFGRWRRCAPRRWKNSPIRNSANRAARFWKASQEHWTGLVRFVDDPRIPMDNNASERAGRGPAVARKNFYGSGSLWSGRLAAAMFSLLATLAHWKLNPRRWLTWYLESCAAAGGKAPEDIRPFLPWNLSVEAVATASRVCRRPSCPSAKG